MRDLSYHGAYKRLGNRVMTLIARASGGFRFEDVESGYRVFRIGPLLDAQQYYEGYRYSETVEIAVILARLGYRVCNSYPIEIPVARTRTRIRDAAIDAVCMPLAWYRLAVWRHLAPGQRSNRLLLVLAIVFGLSGAALVLMLTRPFYLGDDSAHSYAHVWYLSEALWRRGEIPLHMSQLENGRALMFPYAFVPWFPAAVAYPVAGDWVVTLAMVAGVAGMLVSLRWWQPAFANPLLLGIFLLNPLLWNGITQFQLATMWAFLFSFLGAGLIERRRRIAAVIALTLAIVAHPMMGTAAIACYVIFQWADRRAFPRDTVILAAVASLIALPATLMFLAAPLVEEAPRSYIVVSAVDNLRRLSIVFLALALPRWRGFFARFHTPVLAAGAVSTAAVLVILPPSGLWQHSSAQFDDYFAAMPVVPTASYRVMTLNNREDGMVEFLRRGAVLSDEFFSESRRRESFASTRAYACFLLQKGTTHVVLSALYRQEGGTNEEQLLVELNERGLAHLEFERPGGTVAYELERARLATEAGGACRH
jgi:hypothetical protein